MHTCSQQQSGNGEVIPDHSWSFMILSRKKKTKSGRTHTHAPSGEHLKHEQIEQIDLLLQKYP